MTDLQELRLKALRNNFLSPRARSTENRRPADRSVYVAAASANALNDELTIIMNWALKVIEDLPQDDPNRSLMNDLLAAAQRAAWTTSGLVNYCVRRGFRPNSAATMTQLIGED